MKNRTDNTRIGLPSSTLTIAAVMTFSFFALSITPLGRMAKAAEAAGQAQELNGRETADEFPPDSEAEAQVAGPNETDGQAEAEAEESIISPPLDDKTDKGQNAHPVQAEPKRLVEKEDEKEIHVADERGAQPAPEHQAHVPQDDGLPDKEPDTSPDTSPDTNPDTAPAAESTPDLGRAPSVNEDLKAANSPQPKTLLERVTSTLMGSGGDVGPDEGHGPWGRDILVHVGGRFMHVHDQGYSLFSDLGDPTGVEVGLGVEISKPLMVWIRYSHIQSGPSSSVYDMNWDSSLSLKTPSLSLRGQRYLGGNLLTYARLGMAYAHSEVAVKETEWLRAKSSAFGIEAALGVEFLLNRRWFAGHRRQSFKDFTFGLILEMGYNFWQKMEFAQAKASNSTPLQTAPVDLGHLNLTGRTFLSGLVVHF